MADDKRDAPDAKRRRPATIDLKATEIASQPAKPAEQNFYMHPAHLDWLTQAPGEETATAARDDKGHKVIAAQRSVAPTTTY